MGGQSLAVQLDVTSEEIVAAMVDQTIAKFGRIDVLVNNAGITQPIKVLDTTVEDWDRIMAVNLKGTFICSKAVIPTMIKQQYGRIVNISSVSGKRGAESSEAPIILRLKLESWVLRKPSPGR